MQNSKTSASDAAALVQAERMRQRSKMPLETDSGATSPEPPKEEVQPVKWIGAEAGEVDETELARKQRAISEKLLKRQKQLQRDGAELERVRHELEALEVPLKAEIMSLRTALEDANKREKALVDEINSLRSGASANTSHIEAGKVQSHTSIMFCLARRLLSPFDERTCAPRPSCALDLFLI